MNQAFHTFGVEHFIKDGYYAGDWLPIARKVKASTALEAVEALQNEMALKDTYADGSPVVYRLVHQVVTVDYMDVATLTSLGLLS